MSRCFFPFIVRRCRNPKILLKTLKYGGEEAKNNAALVHAVVKHEGLALQWASPSLQNSPELVFDAVMQNGLALQWASNTLRNNSKLVLAAVTQNGLALQWASDTLRNDPKVVFEATIQKVSRYHPEWLDDSFARTLSCAILTTPSPR